MPPRVLRVALGLLALGAACAAATDARAFPHVVRPRETLAQIAERYYGKIEMEQLLVVANGLDVGRGIPIAPGMRLEIPAASHHRVQAGETWENLADLFLGDDRRADALAMANDSMPWLAPSVGQEILLPYNLRYVAAANDSILTIAYRFLGDRDQAWMLDRYNRLKGEAVRKGDVVLVPVSKLELTPAGKQAAANACALVRAEGDGRARETQRRADAELPALHADVRGGRYVDAIARGNRLLGTGDLTKPQQATVARALTEAYVAVDAGGLAETACATYRSLEPRAVLDPVETSPKVLRACAGAAPP